MKIRHALPVLALMLFVSTGSAAIFVDANSASPTFPYNTWGTAARTIQDGLFAGGSTGGTVLVTNGVYQTGGGPDIGSNRVNVIYANFIVQSVNGPAVTVIKGWQVPGTTNGNGAARGVYLASGSVLSGFTVTGGATVSVNGSGGGIYCQSLTAVVTNCWIIGNASANDAGGVYQGTINNCIIAGNIGAFDGGGSYQSLLNHCVVSNNVAVLGGGVAFGAVYDSLLTGNGSTNDTSGGAAYDSTLFNCTLTGNFSSSLGAADGCTLNNSIIYYNTNGSFADCYQCRLTNCCTTIGNGNVTLLNNSISNAPGFVSPATGNYRLQTGSPCVDAGISTVETNSTDLDGNPRFANATVDLGAYENQNTNLIHYVTLGSTNPVAPYTNWLTAATNLQIAVGVAQPGEIVAADAGTYTNGSVVMFGSEANRVAVTNGVTLLAVYGPSATRIVGDVLMRGAYVGSNSLVSGFTITNGQTSLSGNATNEQSGGGIWCEPGAAVINCLVVSNFAGNRNNFQTTRMGGGIYGGTISNCTLLNNTGGSGGGAAGGTLWNCTLLNNTGNGGGGAYRSALHGCILSNNAAVYNGVPGMGGGTYQCLAFDCLITAHTNVMEGGGSYQGTNRNCTIIGNMAASAFGGGGTYQSTNYNCVISSNTAVGSGGGAYQGALYNCVLSGNLATNSGNGGGAYMSVIVHCTVTGNKASGTAGGLYNCMAYNSIIYFNSAPTAANWANGFQFYCCMTPVSGNGGDIGGDPLFVDASAGDFQLACGSPCIDAGLSNNIVPSTTNDIRGNLRPVDGDGDGIAKPDMGAYEFNPATDDVPNIRPLLSFNTFSTGFSASFTAQIGGCPDYFWWDFGDGVTVTNQLTVSHAWTSPGTFNVRLLAYFSAAGQTFSDTTPVQVVPQPVYYVNVSNPTPAAPYTNWAKAATSIQQAVGAGITPGRLVLVTNGVYHTTGLTMNGSLLLNGVLLTNGVLLQSVNGAQATTIQAALGAISRGCYVGSNSFMSGFTVTSGNTLSSGDTNRDESGGGFWCEPGGVVSNCVASGDQARYNGAGGFQGTYYNCVFTNNSGGSSHGQGCGVAYATLYNCLVISNRSVNTSSGIGVYQSTLYNCTVTGNGNPVGIANDLGGGVAASTLYNCVVSGNSAAQGGGGYASTFWNCLVAGNSANLGGGVYNGTLFSCTVAGNTSASSGGGVYNSTLTNSIVAFNVANDGSSNSNWIGGGFGWCCTAPLPGGPGNFADDPAFVNPAGGDFHLQPVSPGINSGINSPLYGATDLDGNPRLMGGTVDLGAYEFQAQVTGTFDAWLQQYGLPADGSADNADSDGTGMSNWQKWIAGLNPTNSASVLAMLPLAVTNNSTSVTITWQSVSNRIYYLQRSSNLSAPFAIIHSNLAGQDGTTTYIDMTATGPGPFFYRIGVQ